MSSHRRGTGRRAFWISAALAVGLLLPGAALPAFADELTGSLSGTVTSARAGYPAVPGAVVTVARADDPQSAVVASAQTGEFGRFRITGLAPASYLVSYRAPDDAYLRPAYYGNEPAYGREGVTYAEPVVVTDGVDTPGVDFRLRLDDVIEGTVYGPDETPLSGVVVELGSGGDDGEWSPRREAVTNENGRYRIGGAFDGRVRATPPAASGLATQFWPDAAIWQNAPPITTDPGVGTIVDFQLVEGHRISGTLSDAHGEVEGASVTPYARITDPLGGDRWADLASVTSESDGSYVTGLLKPGTYRLGFRHSGHTRTYLPGRTSIDTAADVVVPADRDVTGVDDVLLSPTGLAGVVTDGSGTPIPMADVIAYRLADDGTWDWAGSTSTDPSGRYALTNLSAGEWRVKVKPPSDSGLLTTFYGGSQTLATARTIVLTSGASEVADIRLSAGGTIVGTVIGPDGTAAAGVSVYVISRQAEAGDWDGEWQQVARTAEDGTYAARGLASSTYGVAFAIESDTTFAPQYWNNAPTPYEADDVVLDGTETVTVDAQLAKGGTISGTVVRPDGTPASGAVVTLYLADHDGTWGGSTWPTTTTDDDGHYSFTRLAATSYRVLAEHFTGSDTYYGGASALDAAAHVAVSSGQESTADIPLRRGGVVSGTVTADGVPYPTRVWAEGSGDSSYTWADETGHFEITGLDSGDYDITFYPEDALATSPYRHVHVVEGLETKLESTDLHLDRLGSVAGRVVDTDGKPLAGIDLHLVDRVDVDTTWWVGPSARTTSDGTYVMEDVAPGTYWIELDARALGPWTEPDFVDEIYGPVTVGNGEDVTGTDVILGPPGAVTGHVSSKGAAAAGVRVFALARDTTGAWYEAATTTTDTSGKYALELPADTYRLRFEYGTGFAASFYTPEGPVATLAAAADVVIGSETSSKADLAISAQGRVGGIVSAADGRRLAGRTVELFTSDSDPFDDAPVATATTSSTGAYTTPAVAVGRYKLRVRGDGTTASEWFGGASAPADASPVHVALGVATAADVVLDPGGSLGGHVAFPGEPAEGQVSVVDPASNHPIAVTDWDRSGDYLVTGLPVGSYRVEFARATSSRFEAQFYPGIPEGSGPGAAATVTVGAGLTTTGIDASLRVGGTISGALRGANGVALVACHVRAYTTDGRLATREDTTDASGSFTLAGLATGAYRVKVDAAGPAACGEADRYYDLLSPGRLSISAAAGDAVSTSVGNASDIGTLWVDAMPPMVNLAAPRVTGQAKVGSTLTATPGAWSPAGGSASYTWLADGAPIRGATGRTLVVAPSLVGKKVSVRVVAAKSGYLSKPATSASTAAIMPGQLSDIKVRVRGKRKVGKVLRAIITRPAGTTVKYTWTVTVKRKKLKSSKAALRLTPRMRRGKANLVVTVSRPGYTSVRVAVKGGKIE